MFVTPERREARTIRWADLDGVQLCLLSGEMQNRRIIDSLLREAGAVPGVRLQTNSISALFSFLREGWPCIVSQVWLDLYGVPAGMGAMPITGPEVHVRSAWSCRAPDLSRRPFGR